MVTLICSGINKYKRKNKYIHKHKHKHNAKKMQHTFIVTAVCTLLAVASTLADIRKKLSDSFFFLKSMKIKFMASL